MARKPVKAAQEPDLGRVCGACYYFQPFGKEEDDDGPEAGQCFFNPPQIQVDEDGYNTVRPIVTIKERACGRFKPAQ